MRRKFFTSVNRWARYSSNLKDVVQVVVDVGASDGNWWSRHRKLFRDGIKLISIEPLTSYSRMPLGILERCLVGTDCGERNLYVSKDPYTSSSIENQSASEVLMCEQHTLECILRKHNVEVSTPLFIKTDVQGGDVDALLSAGPYLKNLVAAQCELQMYQFDPKMLQFTEAVTKLGSAGLGILEFMDPLERPLDGRLGQIDVALSPLDGPLFSAKSWV
jgi:FkbM family methyltransferase